MTTSEEHERIKKWLADLLAVYFEEAGIEILPRGQATLRAALRQAGCPAGRILVHPRGKTISRPRA